MLVVQRKSAHLISKFLNLGMLLGGFGLGQGSLFVAQTILVAKGQLELLAFFGMHFTFAVLAILLVEAGSIVSLSRFTLSTRQAKAGWDPIWRQYWSVSTFRFLLAATLVVSAICYCLYAGVEAQTSTFLLFFIPGVLVWSFNAVGIIDGLNRSGVSGIMGALPYVAASVSLVFLTSTKSAYEGAIIGAALSAGYVLTVFCQFLVLKRFGAQFGFYVPTAGSIVAQAKEGISLLATQLPGQLYFRLQVLVSSSFLGADATALLIYAKQIVSGLIQVIAFVRRTEFPRLVEIASSSNEFGMRTIFRAQRLGNSLAAIFALASLGFGMAATLSANTSVSGAGYAVAIMAPTVFTNTISLALNQGLFALARYKSAATGVLTSMFVGTLATIALAPFFGLIGFGIADVIQHLLNTTLAAQMLSRRPKKQMT